MQVVAYEEQIKWFHEASFGLFIHWGLSSLLERGEWVMFRERIPAKGYQKLAGKFTGVFFNTDAIARLAVVSGMKYAVLTTRHHEDFCRWMPTWTHPSSMLLPAKPAAAPSFRKTPSYGHQRSPKITITGNCCYTFR